MSRILIAEDEERISSFVDKGLRAAGFTTTLAATGDDALGFALSGSVDLVLLDIGLPGIDGFEVLRRLRAIGADATFPWLNEPLCAAQALWKLSYLGCHM